MPRPQSSIESVFKQSLSNPAIQYTQYCITLYVKKQKVRRHRAESRGPSQHSDSTGQFPQSQHPSPSDRLGRVATAAVACGIVRSSVPCCSDAICPCMSRIISDFRSTPLPSVVKHKKWLVESPTQWMLSALIAFRASVVLKFQKVIPFL